ncbi:sulfite exporter TauE/SafE family protein, partial [Enterococcus gallinarum]
GAKVSTVLSPQKVTLVFQTVILLVLIINLYNGYQLL